MKTEEIKERIKLEDKFISKIALVEYIKKLMNEHEEAGYCTDYERAVDESSKFPFEDAADRFYDAGRFEALLEVLFMLEAQQGEF